MNNKVWFPAVIHSLAQELNLLPACEALSQCMWQQ